MKNLTYKNIFLLISFLKLFTINAQTSGPTQPEVQSFQPVSITNMVEPSSGEFQYNIPLFTIGDYPVNINYNSQVGMENEASMVGLGFNLNCGAITRQVRGIPDDFDGDIVIKKVNMKPNKTFGLDIGRAIELVGFEKKKGQTKQLGINASTTAGLFYNNYNGYGIENRVGTGFSGNIAGLSGNAGIGINSNSQHGTSINPYVGLSYAYKKGQDDDSENSESSASKFNLKNTKFKTNPSAGAGYDFNSISYTPKIDFPFTTVSVDFSFKAGFAGAYFQVGGDIRGYSIVQKFQTNEIKSPAFGFLFADRDKIGFDALLDFNRDNDGIMTEDKKNLPFSYATPDVYSVAGQGINGVFEVKRNNIFVAYDPAARTNSHNGGLEIELGFGVGQHIGADLRYGYTLNKSEKWAINSNEILGNVDFMPVKNSSIGNTAIAEQTYFKNPNDVMFNNNPIYDFSGIKPMAAELKNIPFFGGKSKHDKINVDGQTKSINSLSLVNQKRDNRLDVIYYLNAKEASLIGIQKTIPNYTLNNFNTNTLNQLPRVDANKKEHHLSEMICLKADGSKYVFNIPAYNISKKEVSYSVNEVNVNSLNYLTSYFPDLNRIENKNNGKDDFISVTETPAYAHSFLLGSVLSPNYIDVDDNGPSTNDLGDYVKFNYSKKHSNYGWRSNNDKTKANADLGNLADNRDARAYYTEGTKEIWYVHSIESKNEIARFYYSDRQDAYDINNPNNKLQKLDSIHIYSRPELEILNPTPIKRIYFDFKTNTPLCKGIYNDNSKSKLTLNSLYFKNGSSNKGRQSPYLFSYSNFNPNYNPNEVDRWGNYKPSNNSNIALDNKHFPFVNQESRNIANQNASAWLLNKISLPSGGMIEIDYEAHDYAFVQNKRAMYMTKIIGVTKGLPNNLSDASKNVLYNGTNSNNYLIFKLKNTLAANLSNADANALVKQNYFSDPLDNEYGSIINNNHSNLYGKFRVNLISSLGFNEEDIPVFLNAKDCGALKFGNSYDYGYILLENTSTETNLTNDANQISKIAWQFVKHSYSQILFEMDADPALSSSESMEFIANALQPAANVVKTILKLGPYKKLRDMKVAQTIVLDKSYIRLYVPDNFKIGGNGARVKQVKINDNWKEMTNNSSSDASYTINYEYTKKVNNEFISSGVASYEPELGGEENPWKQPIFFKTKNFLMPDDNNFMMTPYGESLFPSANIIYSEVKITQNPINNNNQIGTGFTKNEFYTFYDFPCKVSNTTIELVRDPKVNFKLLKNISNDYMVTTQGYAVTTNDMHGKPKSEATYGDKGNLISAKYFNYKTNSSNELSNLVKSIDKNGSIKNDNLLGVESQLYGDSRMFSTQTFSGSVHGNVDVQTWGVVPTAAPSIWPDFAYEIKKYSSFVLCKHTRLQGILDNIKVFDKGSEITTKNELWDEKTGAVLLTSTINEFKDPIYSFTYPAHWSYSGMGMASDNIGASLSGVLNNSADPTFIDKLQIGDILGITDGSNSAKIVIESTSPLTTRPLYNTLGNNQFSGTITTKIISSGKKNIATTPIGNFTSLNNPIGGTQFMVNSSTKVINSEAIEYGNFASRNCTKCEKEPKQENNYRLNSTKNIAPWQPMATYKFVDERTQTNNYPNLRLDGFISNFDPFWMPTNGNWIKNSNQKWQFTEKVSVIDDKFNIVQSKNPLNIFSNVISSNFDGLVNATTSNSKYHENIFDGFEDIVKRCEQNHYSIFDLENIQLIDNTTAHTGNFSMKTDSNVYTKSFSQDENGIIDYSETKFNDACPIKLTLLPNKKYIISVWVKERPNNNNAIDYNNAQVKINFSNSNVIAKPEGQIIDGWQRIEKEFLTPNGNTSFTLEFSANTNFDDFRIFPAEANMKSYVYSGRDYSLMAILDENNYATFYEYDGEKQLKRVKKETEKGVVTIQEVNSGSNKKLTY